MRRKPIYAVVALAVLAAGCSSNPGADLKRTVTKTAMTELKQEMPGEMVISSDNKRLAYTITEGDKQQIVVDGKIDSRKYSQIQLLMFSPNGKHLMYGVEKDKKWGVVLNGKESKLYDSVAGLVCTDGTQVFIAEKNKKESMVVNGKEGEFFANVLAPIFSPDTKRLSYLADVGEKKCAVVDGKKTAVFTDIGAPVYSPDSKHVAYRVQDGEKSYIVHDGVKGKVYGLVNDPVFSQDSKHIAYSAVKGAEEVVVVDGKESEPHPTIDKDSIRLSGDGSRVAFVIVKDKKKSVVVDGQVSAQAYEDIDPASLTFSPDDSRLVYTAAATRQHASGKKITEWFLVEGDKEGKRFDKIAAIAFSPDGQHLAYTAETEKKMVAVADDVLGPKVDIVKAPLFSSAGQLALSLKKGEKCMVSVDQSKHNAYLDVWPLVFSPEGKHSAYVATIVDSKGKAGRLVVVDGNEGTNFDDIIEGNVIFTAEDKICYAAIAKEDGKNQVYYVEEKIESKK